MNHERLREMSAGYVLDALDDEDRILFEAHLSGCESCREEVAGLWKATASLAVAATGPEPSPQLRARLLDSIHTTPQDAGDSDLVEPPLARDAAIDAGTVVPLRRHHRLLVPALAATAALAAAVALALGIWGMSVSRDLDRAQEASGRNAALAAALADPDARSVALEANGDVLGRVVVRGDGAAVLVTDGLGEAPDGRTYEAWVVRDGQAEPAGLFADGDGAVVLLTPGVASGDVVAVTLEDAGGAEQPSGKPVATTSPA